MEISLPIPNLDNRTYEQLLEEARKSITNYASQWTNHNPADPGITLIELFAWLAEITSYRINLVTEEHLLKYLKLLGFRPSGVLPATVDLCFETDKIRHLEKSTVFLAQKASEKIDFVLLEDITLVPLQLEKIIVDEKSVSLPPTSSLNYSKLQKLSRGFLDRSIANKKEDLFFAPFGLDTRINSKMYLGFTLKSQEIECDISKISLGPESLNLMCYLYERDLIEPGKHGGEAEYKLENAKLKWEIQRLSDKERWTEVFPKDNTQNFTKSGSLLFTGLKDWVRSTIDAWPSQENEQKYFWLRCTLLESEYEYPPKIEKISLNTAQVIQKKIVKDTPPEKSNGLPGQVFELHEVPVLRESLKLTVAGEKWTEVEDFDGSGPDNTHFTLNSLKGEIRFGDGLRGKVPREGAEILVIEYESTKGEQGNLPAGSLWTAKGEVFEREAINNLMPAIGGRGEESITEAFERFIRDLRVPYRTVTSEDFEYIARETPGLRVAQAKAIPNFDPYSKAETEGSVTVVIIPFSPLDTLEVPPRPSRSFITAVARHLENHRLLGTRLFVVSPEYVQVEVTVTLGISKGFFKEKVKEAVINKLNLFLHPSKGGILGKGWPVGKSVYRSELYKLIMGIEGVEFVEKISIYAQKGDEQDKNGDLKLTSKIATVYSGKHSVRILENQRYDDR
jgi:hypothetical protein